MKFKVASINFWGLAWPFSIHKKKRMQRLADFIMHNDFDIVCLQELWMVKDVLHVLNNLEGYNSFFDGRRKINPSGLLILSKYTLHDCNFHAFGAIDYEKVLYKKGMLMAKCVLPDYTEIRIINTHLYATLRPLNSKIWQRQVSDLYSVFNDTNSLIFGDFNYHYPNFPFPDLNLLSPADFPTRSTENFYSRKVLNKFSRINMACDLIFSNFQAGIIEQAVIKEPLISDHYPVSVVIEF